LNINIIGNINSSILVIGCFHGDEPQGKYLIEEYIKVNPDTNLCFVPCLNKYGYEHNVRTNSNGVDLNRNFPTANWSACLVQSRSILEAPRDTELSAGKSPASEPEVLSLVQLIEDLKPKAIVSLHSPIGCIDAPVKTLLVQELMAVFNVPWVADIGYKTPGSFGTWCKEKSLECVTIELPRLAPELLFERYGKGFIEFLRKS
jgi:protein MpaA